MSKFIDQFNFKQKSILSVFTLIKLKSYIEKGLKVYLPKKNRIILPVLVDVKSEDHKPK